MSDMSFPSLERSRQFREELNALLERYPEIKGAMAREHEQDTHDDKWLDDDENFDPASPVFYDGWVLVVSTANMQGWRDIAVMIPRRQNIFTTRGMLDVASEMQG